MATDDILGTGYQPPAKPFNVISPGGVSGAQSLGMLTSMKNQASENATRMNIAQQQMQHEQQMQEQQIAFEAQEAEKQRKMMEERYRDENFFRERSEELSYLYQDHQSKKDQLDRMREQAILAGNWEEEGRLGEQIRALDGNTREIAKKMNGLSLLKQGREGLFSKNFQNDKGSLGAQFIDAITKTSEAKRQQFSKITRSLAPVLERIHVEAAQEQAKKDQPGLVSRAMEAVVGAAAGGPAMKKMVEKKGGVSQEEAKDSANTEKWDELSAVLASSIIGKSGSTGATSADLALTVKTMLSSLDQAANASGELQAALAKKAKEQYLKLEESGADVRLLDRIFYSMYESSAAGQRAAGAASSAASEKEEGQVTDVGRDPSKMGHLNKMILLMSTMQDERLLKAQPGQRPPSTKLMKAWDSDDMDMYLGGDATGQGMEKMILDTVSVLAGASDPNDLMRKLVNSDPNDDPASLQFINDLHPEVRQALVHEMQKGLMQLEDLDKKVGDEYGVEAGADLVGKMKALEAEKEGVAKSREQATLSMGQNKAKRAVEVDTKFRREQEEEDEDYQEQRREVRRKKSPSQEAREKLEGKEKDPLRK